MDYWLVLAMAAVAFVFWIVAAMRTNQQAWVRIGVWPATPVLAIYFLWQLAHAQAALYSGGAEIGWPVLLVMIGGFCAILNEPQADDGTTDEHHDDGAAAC